MRERSAHANPRANAGNRWGHRQFGMQCDKCITEKNRVLLKFIGGAPYLLKGVNMESLVEANSKEN